MEYDYGIIGGGPAGYTFGLLQAKQGAKVIIFEKNKLGGTCLNKGCIPTKAMLHSAEIYYNTTHSDTIGLDIQVNSFNFEKITEQRENVVNKVRKSLELVIKNAGIDVIYSKACIKDKNTISTENGEYKCKEIIVATGSEPKTIKGLEFDGQFILSSDDILNIKNLPQKILIVGSGAIGIEWARIFSNFGVDVSLVELAEHLLPIADVEVSKRLERIFKQKKIKFFLNDKIEKIENKIVTLKSGNIIEPDYILCAVGRTIQNKEYISRFKIIGDACGEIQLAHYAIHQAKNLALNIPFDKKYVPSVIYGEPEIAWVGLREQDCDETYKKIVLPISALGKSWCDNATDGFIKIIEKNNNIAGAHVISKGASDIIHEFVIAMQNKINVDKLKEICFAHPTYSEGIFETVMRI